MADPIYQWRPTGTQQPGGYFGGQKPQSFGAALNGSVQAAGGAQSPFQAPSQQPAGGFNVPGGSSAGFDSASFSGAQGPATKPNDGAPPPQSFADGLRQNPLAQSFPTSPTDAATQAALRSAVGNLQPNQSPSMSSMFALNEENKGEAEALRKAQESSALNGRAFTGQIAGDTADTLAQKIIPQRQDFLGQLQGQEQQQAITKQQNAQGNILALTGQANQAQQFQQGQAQQASQFGQTLALNTQLGMGDLSIREKTLAQGASQFKDQLSFQKYATDQGFSQQEAQRAWQATQNQAQIASTEKVAFAGLNLQQQQIANQAMQFQSKQAFDTWALQQNLSQDDKDKAWQAVQNEKDRQLQSGQGDLNRTLQQYIADRGFNMDSQKLAAQVQQFTDQLSFQKWATQAGLDANTQKLVWQANENDIDRKQQLGMQLTANEQQVRMQGLQEAHDTAMADLNHTLNLDTLDKQQANTLALKTMDQNFQSYMSDKGFGQAQALDATKQDYALALQKQGFDQQTSLQAADQWFKGQQAQADRDQQKTLSEAQMAQQYDFFNKDLQQKYNFHQEDTNLAVDKINAEMTRWQGQMGLDQAKFDYLKKSDAFTQLSGTVSTLMAMAGDNKDMQQFAAETFYKGLGSIKGPDGQPIMSTDQAANGLLALKASAFTDANSFSSWAASQKNADGSSTYTQDQISQAKSALSDASTPKAGADAFSALVDKNGRFATPEDAQKLKDYANTIVNKTAAAPAGKKMGSAQDIVSGGDLDTAIANLRAAGVSQASLDKIVDRNEVGQFDTHADYNATPEMINYALYTGMIGRGMSADAAAQGLSQLIGQTKAQAALSLNPSLAKSSTVAPMDTTGLYGLTFSPKGTP